MLFTKGEAIIAFAVLNPTPEIWQWEDNHKTSLGSKNCLSLPFIDSLGDLDV